jgi:hypothetical protein
MMLDPIIPSHQFAERHVATLPALVCRTLWQVDFARSPVIRLLFGISGLARRFRQGRGRMHARLEDCRGGQRVPLLAGGRDGDRGALRVVLWTSSARPTAPRPWPAPRNCSCSGGAGTSAVSIARSCISERAPGSPTSPRMGTFG